LRKDSDDGVECQSRPQRHEPQMAPEPQLGAGRGGWTVPARERLYAVPEVGKGREAGAPEGAGRHRVL